MDCTKVDKASRGVCLNYLLFFAVSALFGLLFSIMVEVIRFFGFLYGRCFNVATLSSAIVLCRILIFYFP
uniref:Uncharacterized protein n=1 Tax=Anopheles minimus TaxID=112268 RepID=A0A182WPC4_9DIPT